MALSDISPFREAARRVRRRIGKVQLLDWINRSHWIAGGLFLAVVVSLRLFWEWREGEFWVVMALFGGWVLLGWILTLISRPSPLEALRFFDRRAQRNDEFSSAFAFLRDSPVLSAGEKLHVSQARKDLFGALDQLPTTLPMPSLKKAWILPLLALLLSATPLLRQSLQPGDRILSEAMMKSAAAEAERIRKVAQDLSTLQSLSEEEKKELSQLESSVNTAAGEIAQAEGQTTREVLASLEARARAAERLAEKLGLSDTEWASEELVRELGQHVDTADLAIGVRDKHPELVSSQATGLAAMLKEEKLTREAAERITIALEKTMARATEADKGRAVGQHLGNASGLMAGRLAGEAAREFEKLALHFDQVQQREAAQEKLQKLATQLRNSGSQISGSQLESLRQLSERETPQSSPEGLKPIEMVPMTPQLQNLTAPQIPAFEPGVNGAMPVPGSDRSQPLAPRGDQPGEEGKMDSPLFAPVPGQEGKQSDGMTMSPGLPGGQKGGFLSAPIPGAGSEMNLPGSGLGGSDQPSDSASLSGSGGGNQAGSASMELFDQKSQISQAQKESLVATKVNAGDSEVRQVDGQSGRTEEAKVSRREIMMNFIDVEEEALDSQTLPLTRRHQVLRYFTEIRRSLEKEPAPGEAKKGQ